MRLAYNTNGLAHHRPLDAVRLLGDLGYGGVAITPDVGPLDPLGFERSAARELRSAIDGFGLGVAIETGARFVLDPRRKHRPTLLEEDERDRALRRRFLDGCFALAGELGAGVVSIWSGAAPTGAVPGTLGDVPDHPLGPRLADELVHVLGSADRAGVRVAFEPEPGMFVERVQGYHTLLDLMGSTGDGLALTLDTGHCVVTGDLPVSAVVRDVADRLAHVHVADCPHGVHDHRPLGEGDLDLADALGGLQRLGYEGLAAVEQSRDSHRGPDAAARALGAMRRVLTPN
ncbi:MAG: sugar phosphate isomerase/epimerase family protein [Planctomycetota bacterium]